MKSKKGLNPPAAGADPMDVLQNALRVDIRRNGPIVLWVGNGKFLAKPCLRGLNLDVAHLATFALPATSRSTKKKEAKL